jgi:hypothetical protein
VNETWFGTIPLIGTVLVGAGSWFYMWGGRSGKWKRRFVGSAIISTAIWVEALLLGVFNWVQLAVYPLLMLAFHMGYGGETPAIKVFKRSLVVACTLLTGLLYSFTIGGSAWIVLPIQAVVGACSVWLAVKNPIPAAAEEFFVCNLLTFCNLMYPFCGRAF